MVSKPARWILPTACATALLIGAALLFGDGPTVLGTMLTRAVVVADWVHGHPLLGALGYVMFATLGKITPFPSAMLVMLTGGYLFGTAAGGLLAATAATLAASLVYLAGRGLFAGAVEKRLGTRVGSFRKTIHANAFCTILAMRLMPGMPAWLLNLLPVPFPVPVRTIVLATFLGILPMCLIAGSAGHSLAILGSGPEAFSPRLLLRPEIWAPLIGLAILATLPIIVRSRAGAGRHRISSSSSLGAVASQCGDDDRHWL